ncbi:MAG: hypothetical protein WDN48_03440 [Pseudolabrys sp.]
MTFVRHNYLCLARGSLGGDAICGIGLLLFLFLTAEIVGLPVAQVPAGVWARAGLRAVRCARWTALRLRRSRCRQRR